MVVGMNIAIFWVATVVAGVNIAIFWVATVVAEVNIAIFPDFVNARVLTVRVRLGTKKESYPQRVGALLCVIGFV